MELTINAFLDQQRGEDKKKSPLSSGPVIKELSSLVGTVIKMLHQFCDLLHLGSGVGEDIAVSVCLGRDNE